MKLGKMFVSANLISVINICVFYIIWAVIELVLQGEEFGYVTIYAIFNFLSRSFISYLASI